MKFKIVAFTFALLLILNMAGPVAADPRLNVAKRAKANQLVAMLPQSDAIMTMDVERFFATAMPGILAGNPQLLASVTQKIDEMRSRTGIDIRRFELLTAGVNIAQTAPSKYDFRPVIIARGDVDTAALIASAKTVSGNKYKEERVGSRSMYIFNTKQLVDENKPAATGANAAMVDKVINALSTDVAVTVVDANTLAFGYQDRVREMLAGGSKASGEVVKLLDRKPFAVMNFAGSVPAGLSSLLPLDNDELGKNIDSIRFLFGMVDVDNTGTSMHVTAKTMQSAQAQGLEETLEGLKLLGGMLLGNSKRADQQMYARLIQNVQISRSAAEVSIDLKVPQTDVNELVALIK